MKAEIHPEISTTMIISIAASENSPHANLSGQAPRGSPLSARKPDGERTRFCALAKALPRALFDRFDRPQAERCAVSQALWAAEALLSGLGR